MDSTLLNRLDMVKVCNDMFMLNQLIVLFQYTNKYTLRYWYRPISYKK